MGLEDSVADRRGNIFNSSSKTALTQPQQEDMLSLNLEDSQTNQGGQHQPNASSSNYPKSDTPNVVANTNTSAQTLEENPGPSGSGVTTTTTRQQYSGNVLSGSAFTVTGNQISYCAQAIELKKKLAELEEDNAIIESSLALLRRQQRRISREINAIRRRLFISASRAPTSARVLRQTPRQRGHQVAKLSLRFYGASTHGHIAQGISTAQRQQTVAVSGNLSAEENHPVPEEGIDRENVPPPSRANNQSLNMSERNREQSSSATSQNPNFNAVGAVSGTGTGPSRNPRDIICPLVLIPRVVLRRLSGNEIQRLRRNPQ